MGYKAGHSSSEARLADQAALEVEPVESDSKSLPHQHLIQPLTKEEESRKEKDERDCEVLESPSGVSEEEEAERKTNAKGCSFSKSECEISGLPPCPSTVPDRAYPATATGKALELSLSCLGQKTVLEEPQLSKEQEDDREHEERNMEEDEDEKTEAKPTGAVPVEKEKVEEHRDSNGENLEVVEVEEEDQGSEISPDEELVEQICKSPVPPLLSSEPPTTTTVISPLQGAYMWSLELLIAAALCASRDALCPPVLAVQPPSPPPHNGMKILGELAELERRLESNEKDSEGEKSILKRCFCAAFKSHIHAFFTISKILVLS